ncbi:unnamed protein product [Blepharisma stoltei]|uniref:Prokaryotic-type class I peptide chain release factors domain-containing protein n=1 Tax=Blepharisma stoltei TaxID=1481888 RepID=A0AAU9JFM4_9CILI|nr:unnamed protein product [Blepharisma stoltei]
MIRVPQELLEASFCRSSGPGGQAVNKVSTKVDLRFSVDDATWLPEHVKERLKELYHNQINKEGELFVTSQRFRDQKHNLKDAIQKIQEMVDEAEKPVIIRVKTEIFKEEDEVKDKRIFEKKKRSDIKKGRQGKGNRHEPA